MKPEEEPLKAKSDNFKDKVKRIYSAIKKFCKDHWAELITIIAGVIFLLLLKDKRLLTGSLILIIGSFLIYILPRFTKKEKENLSLFGGVMLIVLGLLGLAVEFLLPNNVFLFLIVFVSMLIAGTITYASIHKKLKIPFKVLAIILLLVIIKTFFQVVESTITDISSQGFQGLNHYILTLLLLFSILLFIFALVKTLGELLSILIGKEYDPFFYLSISIIIFMLSTGYIYLTKIPKEDVFTNFLIILGFTFFTSFMGVDAFKRIVTPINKRTENTSK
ncbi:MAG: hypothetical protein PHT54_04520 [Candidatus Nanoarchaeia archaeon]|nr:hypothetical protein [Candidatus Nanoarchaeia archaeon]